jgi:tetratricopeptide (TPR) repeat protein
MAEPRRGSRSASAAIVAAALIVGVGMVAVGKHADLPGSLFACALAAVGLLGFAVTMSLRGESSAGRNAVLATAVTALVMAPLIVDDTVRFRFYSSAGRNHQLLGDPADAVEDYLRATNHAASDDPDLAGLYHNLGTALEQTQRTDEAADAYRESLRIEPAFGPAHLRLATLLRARGAGDEAIEHYRRGLDTRPEDAHAHYDLAMLLIPRGVLDEATFHLREVLRVRPGWAPAMSNLALLLVVHPSQAGADPSEATRLAEGAARVTRFRDAAILGSLAEVYARTDNSDRAIATVRQAIEIATADGNEGLIERLRRQLDGYE